MITAATWRRGLEAGLKTSWILGKVVFPITFLVGILKYTPVLDWITILFRPVMSWIGLPGEAAIPLTLAFFLSLYAGIAAVLSLSLEVKEVFILAVMMSFAHNLLIETAVTRKMGVSAWISAGVRLGLAFGSAFLINFFWNGGTEKAQYGWLAQSEDAFQSWSWVVWQAFLQASIGMLQLIALILPLMVIIQLMKEGPVLKWLSKLMSPFTRLIGLPENASLPVMAGLFFGLAFGAGVLLQAVEEEQYSKKHLILLVAFLGPCHAIIEDTLIFIPLGIPVVYLFIIRFTSAVVVAVVLARMLRKMKDKASLAKA